MNRKMFRTAFPDGHWHEEDLFAEGDRVVRRYILRGTHQGDFFGIPATGKALSVSNMHIMRLIDGKIVERWGHGDDMGMMRQLGAMAG